MQVLGLLSQDRIATRISECQEMTDTTKKSEGPVLGLRHVMVVPNCVSHMRIFSL